jgi:hypothetical protein
MVSGYPLTISRKRQKTAPQAPDDNYQQLFSHANKTIEVKIIEDPTDKVATDILT